MYPRKLLPELWLMYGDREIKMNQRKNTWTDYEVACLLAEIFQDTCACNYNGIDEWLPYKCELLDKCPDPGVAKCWEQFLKHRAKMEGGDRK